MSEENRVDEDLSLEDLFMSMEYCRSHPGPGEHNPGDPGGSLDGLLVPMVAAETAGHATTTHRRRSNVALAALSATAAALVVALGLSAGRGKPPAAPATALKSGQSRVGSAGRARTDHPAGVTPAPTSAPVGVGTGSVQLAGFDVPTGGGNGVSAGTAGTAVGGIGTATPGSGATAPGQTTTATPPQVTPPGTGTSPADPIALAVVILADVVTTAGTTVTGAADTVASVVPEAASVTPAVASVGGMVTSVGTSLGQTA